MAESRDGVLQVVQFSTRVKPLPVVGRIRDPLPNRMLLSLSLALETAVLETKQNDAGMTEAGAV